MLCLDPATLLDADLAALRTTLVPGDAPEPAFGGSPTLDAHMAMVQGEFAGAPQLLFAHAAVIIRLRRELTPGRDAPAFFRLWREEGAFLLEALSARWLISAADTLVDWSDDPAERQLGFAASLFGNTVKLYETEYHALEIRDFAYKNPPRPEERVDLFDGLTGFVIGEGDMVRNLAKRGLAVQDATIGGQILWELFRRMHCNETVFRRMLRAERPGPKRWKRFFKQKARDE